MDAKVITRDYLRKFFQLGGSQEDTALLNFLMLRLVSKEYMPHSFICRAGSTANEMYFIDSGSVVVRGKNGEVIEEIQAGHYFGEYAAITGEKRPSNIQARGAVRVYELSKEVLQYLAGKRPGIYGLFIKNAQEQSSEKYRKLVKILNTKRGAGGGSRKKQSFRSLLVNYCLVIMVFAAALFFAPDSALEHLHPLWLCSPIVFMVAYMVITQRALEALVLSTMYIMILLSKFNFVGDFAVHLSNTIGGTVDIILIVLLMGSLSRLFTASGSINALKYFVRRRIKSARGTFLTAFLSMVLIAIDEYMSILINGACYKSLMDARRIPREKSAMVMGMAPGALCILSPISITGIYLTGVIAMATGQKGIFLEAVRYNFGAIIAIVFILLLAFEKVPLVGGLKQAQVRVDDGGVLWPDGTDILDAEDDQFSRGRLINLALPVLVLIVSSIIAGTLEAGTFQVNVLYGMCVTLIFAFLLYCFQRYMTPDQFFKNVLYGIESMIAPIAMFLVGKCFANGMDDIGLSAWLDEVVHGLVRGQVWLLPLIIFSVCTLAGALFDNPWAMYAVGIPVAAGFAASAGGNTALYIGAVCAAGLIGNELAPGDIFFIGSILGINPMSYYRAKLPYVIAIAALAFCAYGAAGYFVVMR